MGNIYDKKNAEGYSDPTPYQAIKNMIKPGEVWTFTKKDDSEAEVLVVAFNDNVATILYLMDELKDGCVECVGSDVKWVNPRMLNWAWGGYLGKCVRKLSVQEFNIVGLEIEKILAIRIVKEADDMANHNELDALKAEMEELKCDKEFVDTCCDMLQADLTKTKAEAEKYKVQLEMLKGMYSDLTEKLLQRA